MSFDSSNPQDPAPGAIARQAAPSSAFSLPDDLPPAIQRERPEPLEGNHPMSLLFVTFVAVLFFWGGFYLQRFSGGYQPFSYNENTLGGGATNAPAKPLDPFAEGKRLFVDTCAKCHQADGQGLAGQYPPLAGSEWVKAEGAARIIRIVLDGLQGPIKVKGADFNNQMVPWRDVLTDQQIASVITYVRGEKGWGNNASAISAEQVAAVRQKTKTRPATGSWTAGELLKIPEIEADMPSGTNAPPAGATNSVSTNLPAAK